MAGYVHSKGYVHIVINHTQYKAHRLAFLYMTGAWPPDQVDHINRDRTNNRWSNLRLADNASNQVNTTRVNKFGCPGITMRNGKYRVVIGRYPRFNVGTFANLREATIAYILESLERYGDFSPYNCKGGVA